MRDYGTTVPMCLFMKMKCLVWTYTHTLHWFQIALGHFLFWLSVWALCRNIVTDWNPTIPINRHIKISSELIEVCSDIDPGGIEVNSSAMRHCRAGLEKIDHYQLIFGDLGKINKLHLKVLKLPIILSVWLKVKVWPLKCPVPFLIFGLVRRGNGAYLC